jgi:hypothetical protein
VKVLTLLSNPAEQKELPSVFIENGKDEKMSIEEIEMHELSPDQDYSSDDEESKRPLSTSAPDKMDWKSIVKQRNKRPSIFAQQVYLIQRSWL